jgi:hypothetical protein
MEKASKATWKKQGNMEKAPQHEKSNATWNNHRTDMQKAPQHEKGKATSKPNKDQDYHQDRAHDQDQR